LAKELSFEAVPKNGVGAEVMWGGGQTVPYAASNQLAIAS